MMVSTPALEDLRIEALWSVSTVRDYWELLKPRVMVLVLFTGFVGLLRAPGSLHPLWSCLALLCIGMGAGASGALNMWYERSTDALMKRTQHRPLPQKRVLPEDALTLGLLLSVTSVVMLGLVIHWFAALLLLGTILFYSIGYTIYLKPSTPHNIVWGGLAGALPPVIGWSCVSSIHAWEPWLLCLIICLWTPPHFWSLALVYQQDYRAAGFPMMPCKRGVVSTLRHMRLYTWGTGFAVGALVFLCDVGSFFSIFSTLNTLWFIRCVHRLDAHDHAALKVFFKDSIQYLFVVFVLLVIDSFL